MKIGIISDIHEDLDRLEEALAILHKEKCNHIVCTGDFAGYSVPYYGFLSSRNANEAIKLLKKHCEFTVVGNHDLFSIRKLPEHKAGFPYPIDWYSLDYPTRNKLSKGKIYLYESNELPALLTKESETFIRQLPEYVVKNYNNKHILFSHYAFPDLVGTTTFELKTPKDVENHFAFMAKHDCSLGISGHDHKEGITIFTKNRIREISFNETIQLTEAPTLILGPGVVNGSFANGVLCLNTKNMTIVAIPLKTKKYVVRK